MSVHERQVTSLRTGRLRLGDDEFDGLIGGVDAWDDAPHLSDVGPITFQLADDVELGDRRGDTGVASWASGQCRFHLPVCVTSSTTAPIRLAATDRPDRVQQRTASRVATRLPCRLWWGSSVGVEQLATATVNVSATGLAVSVPRRSRTDGRDLPLLGTRIGVLVDVDGHPMPCVCEVVGYTRSAGRSFVRLRIVRAQRSDVSQLASYVIRTEGRRV